MAIYLSLDSYGFVMNDGGNTGIPAHKGILSESMDGGQMPRNSSQRTVIQHHVRWIGFFGNQRRR